jgi:hypothetical protein
MQSDRPLPMLQDEQPTETQEERFSRLRAAYTNMFNDVMDRVLAEVILTEDKLKLLADAAQFFVFLMVLKMAEANGKAGERQAMLTAFWQLQASFKHDVPDMLRNYAKMYDEAVAAQATIQ